MAREPEVYLRLHRAPSDLLERALRRVQRRRQRSRQRSRQLLAALTLLAMGWAGGWLQRGLVSSPAAEQVVARAEQPTTAAPEETADVELLNVRLPGATEVEVVGSWNNWQPVHMTRAEGTFFTVLHLPRGRYEYMFRVDGERWVQDPGAPLSRDDGFGRRNSILEI